VIFAPKRVDVFTGAIMEQIMEQNLIPEAQDSSEFMEASYEMSQEQAEQEFGAEFETGAEEKNGLEGVVHD
jgi:hypothetical protein